MHARGLLTDEEGLSDLRVGPAAGEQFEYLQLSRSQPVLVAAVSARDGESAATPCSNARSTALIRARISQIR